MKWILYLMGAGLCLQAVNVGACDPNEECEELPQPVKGVVDLVLFPVRPLLEIFGDFFRRTLIWKAVRFFTTPIRYLIRVVIAPIRLIRWLIYLPLHVILSPIRIGATILRLIVYIVHALFWLPRKVLLLPLRILISPVVALRIIIRIPFKLIDLGVTFLQNPMKAIMRLVYDIIHFPYLQFVPLLVIVWLLFIPVGHIFNFLFC